MSAVEMRVRMAVAGDLAEIVRLERATLEAPHWTAEVYAAMLSDAGEAMVHRRLMVADLEGVAGFAVAKVILLEEGAAAELESVVVAQEMRRRGFGRALCEAAIAWCRMQDAQTMELEVRVSSAGAIALYRRLGFIVTGERPMYYRHPTENALLMTLKLR